MQPAFFVAHDDRAAQRQRRGQAPPEQLFGAPDALASGGFPGHQLAVGLRAEQALLVAAHACIALGGLVPQQLAAGCVHAAHGGLKGAGANDAALPAHGADQIDEFFHIVHAARSGQRHFPAGSARVRVHARQAARQARHQRVVHGQQHARLAQHQRLGLAVGVPQARARAAIQRRERAVSAQHEHAPARHQRRGVALRAQLVFPEHAALGQRYHLVAAGDHGAGVAVAAHAGGERVACVRAPQALAVGGVKLGHRAVIGGQHHAIAQHLRLQGEIDRAAELGRPCLADVNHGINGLQLGRFRPGRARRARRQQRGGQRGGAEGKTRGFHFASPDFAAPASGSMPSAVSLTPTRRPYSLRACVRPW